MGDVINVTFGKKVPKPASETEKPAVGLPKNAGEAVRNMVRASAGDTWAGKFKVEAPEGSSNETLDDTSMLAMSAMF